MAKRKGGSAAPLIIGAAIAAGALAMATFAKGEECAEGETKTQTCPDGSVITTHICVNNKFQATGASCETPGAFAISINSVVERL